MAITSYSDLKQEIISHLERDDLSNRVDAFVGLAEDRHRRDIRIREQLTKLETTIDSRTMDVPDDLLEVFNFRLITDFDVVQLSSVNLNELNRLRSKHRVWRSKRTPSAYAIHAEIEFDAEPDQSYDGELIYYAAFPALSTDNETNVLLERASDAYLYASLTAAAPWLMDDDRIQMWEQLYQQSVNGLSQGRRADRYSGPVVTKLNTPGP